MFIRWIVIYPVDSAIHRLNNWGQINMGERIVVALLLIIAYFNKLELTIMLLLYATRQSDFKNSHYRVAASVVKT